MISDIAELISQPVKDYLISKGVVWENFVNWLASVRAASGLPGPEFNQLVASAGSNRNHELWGRVIRWSRNGQIRGIASAEIVATIVLILIVATLFYQVGAVHGRTLVRQVNTILDVNGSVADQEAFNSLIDILNRALASGAWRLKPGWTARDAMLKILINFRTGQAPGFGEILERVRDEGPAAQSPGPI
jgi:hypothetical protein